jgi:hypothetical protein
VVVSAENSSASNWILWSNNPLPVIEIKASLLRPSLTGYMAPPEITDYAVAISLSKEFSNLISDLVEPITDKMGVLLDSTTPLITA